MSKFTIEIDLNLDDVLPNIDILSAIMWYGSDEVLSELIEIDKEKLLDSIFEAVEIEDILRLLTRYYNKQASEIIKLKNELKDLRNDFYLTKE